MGRRRPRVWCSEIPDSPAPGESRGPDDSGSGLESLSAGGWGSCSSPNLPGRRAARRRPLRRPRGGARSSRAWAHHCGVGRNPSTLRRELAHVRRFTPASETGSGVGSRPEDASTASRHLPRDISADDHLDAPERTASPASVWPTVPVPRTAILVLHPRSPRRLIVAPTSRRKRSPTEARASGSDPRIAAGGGRPSDGGQRSGARSFPAGAVRPVLGAIGR